MTGDALIALCSTLSYSQSGGVSSQHIATWIGSNGTACSGFHAAFTYARMACEWAYAADVISCIGLAAIVSGAAGAAGVWLTRPNRLTPSRIALCLVVGVGIGAGTLALSSLSAHARYSASVAKARTSYYSHLQSSGCWPPPAGAE